MLPHIHSHKPVDKVWGTGRYDCLGCGARFDGVWWLAYEQGVADAAATDEYDRGWQAGWKEGLHEGLTSG